MFSTSKGLYCNSHLHNLYFLYSISEINCSVINSIAQVLHSDLWFPIKTTSIYGTLFYVPPPHGALQHASKLSLRSGLKVVNFGKVVWHWEKYKIIWLAKNSNIWEINWNRIEFAIGVSERKMCDNKTIFSRARVLFISFWVKWKTKLKLGI